MSLTEVSTIYANLEHGRTVIHRVGHELFRQFSRRVSELAQLVPAEDLRGTHVIRWLKRYRFARSAAPIEFSHEPAHCLGLLAPVARQELELSYRSESHLVASVFLDLDQLLGLPGSPLEHELGSVLLECSPEDRIAVCTPESRYIACYDQALIKSARAVDRTVNVVSQNQLRDPRVYDRLILFGPATWYRDHVFASPKAASIDVIQFEWIRSDLPKTLILSEASTPHSASRRTLSVTSWTSASPRGIVAPSELLPDDISVSTQARPNDGGVESQRERAVLVALETGHAAFVSAAEESRVLVIDESSGEPALERLSADELEAGMHLVLRTQGSADYLLDVADALLSGDASELRSDQRRWKGALEDKVLTRGVDRVSSQLREGGLGHATPSNVEYWCSDRNIALQDIASFGRLLRYCGMHSETERLWQQAERLRDAHVRAGGKIRQMLLDVLKKADLTALRKSGRMDFKLAVEGAGVLSALTIREIRTGTHSVPSRSIGRPFDISTELPWLG